MSDWPESAPNTPVGLQQLYASSLKTGFGRLL